MPHLLGVNKPVTEWTREPTSINTADGPGYPDVHSNSGFRRMVRIGLTRIVLCPFASVGDRAKRSTNGTDWTLIGSNRPHSGALITGPDNYAYHFYIDRGSNHLIGMVKFLIDGTPGSPVTVYNNSALASTNINTGYDMLSAGVNSQGHLFVITHWAATGSNDNVYVLKSTDAGATWGSPVQLNDTDGGFHGCMIEADAADTLFASWRNEDSDDIRFTSSTDGGATWSATVSHAGTGGVVYSNPSICPGIAADKCYMVTQSDPNPGAGRGVYFKKTTNGGSSWGSWIQVDATCGYGDPILGIAENGDLYCAIRSSNGTGQTSGTCAYDSRQRLMRSTDDGATWAEVQNAYSLDYPGTRNLIRYQSHFGYGGALEWSWMQNESSATVLATYYNTNPNVHMYTR